MERIARISVGLVLAGVVLASCTATDPEPAPDDGLPSETAAASTAPSDGGAPTDDATDPGSGATATASPDTDEGDDIATVLEQIFAAEHVVRLELAERAAAGDELGDVEELTSEFLATRTPEAARAEAEVIADLGGEELAAFTANGVQEPQVGDIDVEGSRTDCVLLATQLDVLPTYNDTGLFDVNLRLVGGEGNPSGWLLDGLSLGDLPDC